MLALCWQGGKNAHYQKNFIWWCCLLKINAYICTKFYFMDTFLFLISLFIAPLAGLLARDFDKPAAKIAAAVVSAIAFCYILICFLSLYEF